MKKILMAVLVGALGYGAAYAQPATGEMPGTKKEMKSEKKDMKMEKKEMKKAKMNVCKGVVEAYDAATGKISVKHEKGEVMMMTIPADAKIMKAGKAVMMSDIMMGDKVHIMYEGDMASPMVKSVKIEKVSMKKEKMKGEKMEKKDESKMEKK